MHTTIRLAIAVVSVLYATAAPLAAAELSENLSMFNSLVGPRWEGHFEDAEEPMTLYMTWEPIIGGASIEMNGWATGSDMTRRNIYYWDPESRQVSYVALTSNGYVARGTVVFEDSVLTFTGLQTSPDGAVVDTRAKWELLRNGSLRAIGYRHQDGEWLAGHKILYKREDMK